MNVATLKQPNLAKQNFLQCIHVQVADCVIEYDVNEFMFLRVKGIGHIVITNFTAASCKSSCCDGSLMVLHT